MSGKDYLGTGVMIGMLGGNETTVKAVQGALGKDIATVALKDDALSFSFADGSKLTLRDDGQSCCEARYMRTDDDLTTFVGAVLQNIEVRDAPDQPDEHGETHEVQFLVVTTSKGVFTMASHNEHNGYYGGFWIVATAD